MIECSIIFFICINKSRKIYLRVYVRLIINIYEIFFRLKEEIYGFIRRMLIIFYISNICNLIDVE